MFVQALFDGDFVVVLVPVEEGDSMAEVAKKVAQHTVDRRVEPQDRSMQVSFEGQILPADVTVTDAGIRHWDVLEVAYA
jgi:toluene monooxygenase system protein B